MKWRTVVILTGWVILAGCALAVGAAPALASAAGSGSIDQTAAPLNVRIERDQSPRVGATELSVNLVVTVTDGASGQPPAGDFEVYALAENATEKTTAFTCVEMSADDPNVAEGVYACTVIVDYGGTWNFTGVVNEERVDEDQPPVTLAQATLPIELAGGPSGGARAADRTVEGSTTEVAVLWGHSLVAAGWLGVVAVLMLLALPAGRRFLSAAGRYRIEERLDLLIRLAWTATAVTVGSGIYLLTNETAYETPFSASGMDNVLDLPYAQPYFLALGTKLALYAAMLGSMVPLVRQVRRQRRHSGAPAARSAARAGRTSAIWSSAPSSGVGTLVAERPPVTAEPAPAKPDPAETRGSAGLRLSALVMLAGSAGIWFCVILLKYFHQLIEATP